MTNTDHAPRMLIPVIGRGNSTADNTVKMMLLNNPTTEALLNFGRLGVAFTTNRHGHRVCILEGDIADLMDATCTLVDAMPAGSFTQLV
jgi:hypothetical protein